MSPIKALPASVCNPGPKNAKDGMMGPAAAGSHWSHPPDAVVAPRRRAIRLAGDMPPACSYAARAVRARVRMAVPGPDGDASSHVCRAPKSAEWWFNTVESPSTNSHCVEEASNSLLQSSSEVQRWCNLRQLAASCNTSFGARWLQINNTISSGTSYIKFVSGVDNNESTSDESSTRNSTITS